MVPALVAERSQHSVQVHAHLTHGVAEGPCEQGECRLPRQSSLSLPCPTPCRQPADLKVPSDLEASGSAGSHPNLRAWGWGDGHEQGTWVSYFCCWKGYLALSGVCLGKGPDGSVWVPDFVQETFHSGSLGEARGRRLKLGAVTRGGWEEVLGWSALAHREEKRDFGTSSEGYHGMSCRCPWLP